VLGHERFEEFAALDAIGQLPDSERAELQHHLEGCTRCSTSRSEFADIVERELPIVMSCRDGLFRRLGFFRANHDYRKRFFARARAQGVQFSSEMEKGIPIFKVPAWGLPWRRSALVAAAALLLVAGSVSWLGRTKSGKPTVTTSAESNSALAHEIEQLVASNRSLATRLAETTESNRFVAARIAQLKKEQTESQGREISLQRALQDAQKLQITLKLQLKDATAQSANLQLSGQEDARLVTELRNELETSRASQTQSEARLAIQQDRIRELSEKLDAQTMIVERERRLLAAGKEIRDLMGARNLHIIDVFDVDGNGATRGRFGRVFYTEGKSLIFYAFELGTERMSAYHSFQAWGWREPARQTVQSLGIFNADDTSQSRWVLKFDDPAVLAQIDSVFVTVEPAGGSRRPTGEKLLSAYLNGQANHP
jgi:hypothetical protein